MVTMEAREIVVFKGAGEGSRGGHVIGHTRSGKPIYTDSHHSSHQWGFSGEDHEDAAKLHRQKETEASKKASDAQNDWGKWSKRNHDHPDVEKWRKIQGEHKFGADAHVSMSRGKGHTIDHLSKNDDVAVGKTESGKYVYDKFSHPAHASFSEDDHRDAKEIHRTHAEAHFAETRAKERYYGSEYDGLQDRHIAIKSRHDKLARMHFDAQLKMAKSKADPKVAKGTTDRLSGGKADGKPPSGFDPKALAQGTKVESEHTNDPGLAREIAMDHLTEDPAYYDKLAKMEKRELVVFKGASGEGSRGGHVIGHTKSGKPVYANFDHREHGSFSASDHQDAMQLHENEMESFSGTNVALYHGRQWQKHYHAMSGLRRRETDE